MVDPHLRNEANGLLQTAPTCPSCQAVLDGFMAAGHHATPEVGDPSVCFYCAALAIFDGDPLTLRQPTQAESEEIGRDPRVRAAQAAIRHAAARGEIPGVDGARRRH